MSNNILTTEKIMLNAAPTSRNDAIALAGELLVKAGHVTEGYIAKMIEREELATTYMGNAVAIPHGTAEAKNTIQSTGISVVQVPGGVDFGDGNIAKLLFGIAAVNDEHLDIIQNLAIIISEEENVEKLVQAKSAADILAIIEEGGE
ncbi:PTS sugar transporter subunit IIA [Paenibacillus sp. N1-5-1-14]|uniref:PTS sugar transporter subunit IIA n=1 Tax=Paenibacillus radicibacter TaxID=2972488 RepID=UPI002158B4AB|nr:PTS sugar transporter subunit IIA [Paenibacillus radicibacter]MCR8642791.1 PTS sugar transporter subunit IIA [Paenibacillus radicibacter]